MAMSESPNTDDHQVNIGVNGAGRIGRMGIRALTEISPNGQPPISTINDPGIDTAGLAYLLRHDSVHGQFNEDVRAESDESISINGREIRVTRERDPQNIQWDGATVLEASGHYRDGQQAQAHIDAGASRVIISAPAKNVDGTFVMGVNSEGYDPERHRIVSLASCTTNATAPIIAVLEQQFGIRSLFFNTIHAYTGDQALVDGAHSDPARGRAAGLNIVPTSTGASQAILEVFPELEATLHGLSTRVPVADGSLLDIIVALKNPSATPHDIRNALREAAQSTLRGILEVSTSALTSSDIIGNTHSSVVLAQPIEKIGEGTFRILAGYDNEMAYATRLAEAGIGANHPGFRQK